MKTIHKGIEEIYKNAQLTDIITSTEIHGYATISKSIYPCHKDHLLSN